MLLDKVEALYSFWSSFGIPAYDETTVPDNAPYPYITYEVSTAAFPDTVMLAASIYYRSSYWEAADVKAQEISLRLGQGGEIVPCDGGGLWIKRGTPFAQHMKEEADDRVRRIYLNIEVDFLTAD